MTNLLDRLLQFRIVRFALTGGLATAIHVSVAFLFLHFIKENVFLANVLGFSLAFIFSYFAQTLLVFKNRVNWGNALRFFIVQFGALLVAQGISEIFSDLNSYLRVIMVVLVLLSLPILSTRCGPFQHHNTKIIESNIMSLKLNFDRTFTWLYALGFLLGLGFCFIYAQNQILTGDQTQMLYKGYLGANQGTWLNFGNAASAVGNVPGSLSTWLIGGPLLVWNSPWSPMLLLIVMRVVSLLLLDNVIKTVFAGQNCQLARLLFLALYWLNLGFIRQPTL